MIYILKENRTYDQILGDLKVNGAKVGNGDPSLTMYGFEITPNQHKLALQFGVLDNFYDSGKLSVTGTTGRMPPSLPITTRRPGRSAIAARSAFTTTRAQWQTSFRWSWARLM